jgi:hypothetical protein
MDRFECVDAVVGVEGREDGLNDFEDESDGKTISFPYDASR